MFGNKRKYRLPSFPPMAKKNFQRLCEALPPDTVPQLKEELESFYENILLAADDRPLVNKDLVRDLYDRASFLLDRYPHLAPPHRALVIGALRYFVSNDDSFPDLEFASGFHDDAEVINYVLEELDLLDEVIAIDWGSWRNE
jgi:uncharacterized membrane protein YkvA (DUF1232 family)